MKTQKIFIITFLCLNSVVLFAKDYSASFFGIRSDGKTLNTKSIQFAIDYINQHGGGRLVFHAGKHLSGTISLKSNVTLHLLDGAIILGSLNPFDYEKTKAFPSFLFAFDQENIAITGNGVIDGQGKYVARNVVANIEKGLIKDSYKYGRPSEASRPMGLYFRECKNIKIEGVTFRNSACWGQTYDQCQNLTIDNIKVDNVDYWNNDGIDIVDCEKVSITNSYVDAADDGICLKSHDAKRFCNDIYIANNTVRSSANAIKFGTLGHGGFKNVKIMNNVVFDTYRSAIALESVDGGFLENIEIDGLKVFNTGNLIFLRIGERSKKERKSTLNNIRISNVYAEIPDTKPDAGYSYEGPVEDLPRNISPAIIITGVPGLLISNVIFKNFEIKHPGGGNIFNANVPLNKLNRIPEIPAQYPDFSMFKELPSWGVYIRHAEGIDFSNIELKVDKTDFRVPIVLDDVHNSTFSELKINQIINKKEIYQNNTTKIEIK
jgi:polygalacturonase